MSGMILSPMNKLTKDLLFLPTPTYSIRNNCQMGLWLKYDGETRIGNELEFCLIHCQMMYGDLGKTKESYWLQLWGISDQILNGKVVFCTYVKGRSLSLLGNAVLEATLEQKNPLNLLFTSKFIRQSNEYGVYYIIGFEAIDLPADDPRPKMIAKFLESKPIFADTNIPTTLFPVGEMSAEECQHRLESIRQGRTK